MARPGDNPPLPIPRTVRPRKATRRAEDLNIITVTPTGVTSEHATGATFDTLSTVLHTAPESLVACHHHEVVFADLDRAYSGDPQWDWQVSRQLKGLQRAPQFAIEEVNITLAGWRNPQPHKRGTWHHFLDPGHFADSARWPVDLDLYTFACDVRRFLVEWKLHPSARAGGIAAQLLRHRDIYESPRRQVPKFINEQARKALPGNHYQFVQGDTHSEYDLAWYLDQKAAHHNVTRLLTLPHSDNLVAAGRYWTPDDSDPPDRIWVSGDNMERFFSRQPSGLLYARIRLVGPRPGVRRQDSDPAPRWFRKLLAEDTAMIYLYTNELSMLKFYGVELEYIVAAWVSTTPDESLPFYAEWAMSQIEHSDELRRVWLKPTLHAAYGMLAARTTEVEFVRKRGRANPTTVNVGGQRLDASTSGPRRFVPKIANVIQRGMIEAETRKRSCLLALQLTKARYRVLSIYADGLLVEPRDEGHGEGECPPLDYPELGEWQAEARLTHLTYADDTHFRAAELLKWPGTKPVEIPRPNERVT